MALESKKGRKAPLKAEKKQKMTKEERRKKYTDIARKRRAKQQGRVRASTMVCFRCRSSGHTAAECPQKADTVEDCGTICYRCGSTEHSLKACTEVKDGKNLPYATCFVCKKMGHLASTCPDNKNGIYVNGGSCRGCGSLLHRAIDCPENKKKKLQTEDDASDSVDVQELFEPPTSSSAETGKEVQKIAKQKKRRVVKF